MINGLFLKLGHCTQRLNSALYGFVHIKFYFWIYVLTRAIDTLVTMYNIGAIPLCYHAILNISPLDS